MCGNIADQTLGNCHEASSPPSNTEPQTSLDKEAVRSQISGHESPDKIEKAEPIADPNPCKRPSSLPQPQLDHCPIARPDRRSLPALSDLEQGTFLANTHTFQPERTSLAFKSLSSLQTEETNGAATGPSSTHSFFRSNSNASSDTSRLSAFKSYFRSKSRPFSVLSELKIDSDAVAIEQKSKLQGHADSRSFPALNSKVASLRIGSDPYEGVEPSLQNTVNGSDRLSAMKQYHFTLPDLAEDSQEDASTTNIRILGSKPPNFRSGAVRRARKENRIPAQPSVALEPPASYVSKSLKDTRNMPSLQFSQTDLTTKLNLALGLPCSLVRDHLGSFVAQDFEEQPGVANMLARQRYKSYFFGQENVSTDDTRTTEMSPETNLGQTVLLTEIERLSIPSVNGLTLRLSELLPAIKICPSQLNLDDSNDNVGNILETPKKEDQGSIEKSKTARRTSNFDVGVTTQTRRSDNGNSLSVGVDVSEAQKDYRLMKDLPPLPREATESFPLGIGPRTDHFAQQEPRDDGPVELEATVPVETPSADEPMPDGAEQVDETFATGVVPCVSVQENHGTPLETGVPIRSNNFAPTELTTSVENPQLNATANFKSPAAAATDNIRINELTPDTTERIVRSMSPGPHIETFLVPQSLTANELEETSSGSKSILESIQKKMSRKPRVDKAGFPVDPIFLHPEERSTEPGDRYPTSGLTPPSHVNVEQARSYFSDDSSESEQSPAGPLRKRLTRLRYRTSRAHQSSQTRGPSRTCSVPESGGDVQNGLRWNDELESRSERSTLNVSQPDMVVVYDQQPVGMSKLEFRAKRFVEKLRIFWSKSENLIRSMSRARKQHPSDWAETNLLYEGA